MGATAHRERWMNRFSSSQLKGPAGQYMTMYKRASAEEASNIFSECLERVPNNVLAQYLHSIAPAPEVNASAFFSLLFLSFLCMQYCISWSFSLFLSFFSFFSFFHLLSKKL